mgnify:CR=1 FL=1
MKNYGMFSQDGNREVDSIVLKVCALPLSTTNEELYSFLKTKMDAAEEMHKEIWDTAVREVMIGTIENRTKRDLTIYF